MTLAYDREIIKLDEPPVNAISTWLAPDEIRSIREDVTHWFIFGHTSGELWASGEIANMLALALWLVKPTKTSLAFRFKVGTGDSENLAGFARLHDRMEWVTGNVAKRYDDNDLVNAARHLEVLQTIGKPGRLNNALLLTLQACWQKRWQAAIVLFAAAAESLLTSSRAVGLTRRLAVAYATIVETAQASRDRAFLDFMQCYEIRSDIVHGRAMNIPEQERLKHVASWANVLRAIWCRALSTPELIVLLEKDDTERAVGLATYAAGYIPPKP